MKDLLTVFVISHEARSAKKRSPGVLDYARSVHSQQPQKDPESSSASAERTEVC